jgi:soluble lytic murein transglycosylase-like protein
MIKYRVRNGGWRIAAIAFASLVAQPLAAQHAPVAPPTDSHPVAADVSDAARRFGIPEHWIYAVMRAESAGRVNATSPVGAMGLMQIMPTTWSQLRARYGFGDDAYDRRDNIMAGAAYIREMYDRYGAPGFLAAYNAGPGRYESYVRRGRSLPIETQDYVARVAPMLDGSQQSVRSVTALPQPNWTQAALFASRADASSVSSARASAPPDLPLPSSPLSERAAGAQRPYGGLFVAISHPSPQ